jgi:hypothetical protein
MEDHVITNMLKSELELAQENAAHAECEAEVARELELRVRAGGLLGREDLARALAVPRDRVGALVAAGMPAVGLPGGEPRYDLSAVRAWLSARPAPAASASTAIPAKPAHASPFPSVLRQLEHAAKHAPAPIAQRARRMLAASTGSTSSPHPKATPATSPARKEREPVSKKKSPIDLVIEAECLAGIPPAPHLSTVARADRALEHLEKKTAAARDRAGRRDALARAMGLDTSPRSVRVQSGARHGLDVPRSREERERFARELAK